jgi:hypothetical protein
VARQDPLQIRDNRQQCQSLVCRNKMMQLDLQAARQSRIEETTPSGPSQRKQSGFLVNRDHAGLFANFHSCQHLSITSLKRAGISPKLAQTLARHSDVRLTLEESTESPDGDGGC